MKKILSILSLLLFVGLYAQNPSLPITTTNNLKITNPVSGAVSDELLVRRTSDGVIRTVSFSNSIKSNESLSGAKRKGDILYGIIDRYTGEEITLSKVTGTPTVDGIMYFQLGSEYFKRVYTEANVKWWGAVGNNVTNDHDAILDAINFAIAEKSGKIIFPDGTYYTSPIHIPYVPFSEGLGGIISIELSGVNVPPQTYGTIGYYPLENIGAVIRCDSTTPGERVIKVDNAADAFYNFSQIKLIVKNLTIRTYDNPVIGGIDAGWAQQLIIDNVNIDTDIYNVDAAEPTTASAKGLVPPTDGNGALTQIGNVSISGYYDGMESWEHVHGVGAVNITGCLNGLRLRVGSHLMYFSRLTIQNCTIPITVDTNSYLVISELNIEHLRPEDIGEFNAWQVTTTDINDPDSYCKGSIAYGVTESETGPANTFTVNGAENIKFFDIRRGNVTYNSITASDILFPDPITETYIDNSGLEIKFKDPTDGFVRTLMNFKKLDDSSFLQLGGFGVAQSLVYGYLGKAFNNATIKWNDTGIGINLSGTDSPTEAVDVVGGGKFTGKVTAATLKLTGLPVYANEAAAIVGGLTTGDVYQTSTGELRIKL